MNTPWSEVQEQVDVTLQHWDVMMIAERYEDSLAVLMHALKWRLVDLVGLPINMHNRSHDNGGDSSHNAVQSNDSGDDAEGREFDWVMRVDNELYNRANRRLDEQLRELPVEYEGVQEALTVVTRMLGERCRVRGTGKHYSAEDRECVKRFREEMLVKAAGAK